MILDDLKNAEQYFALHPGFAAAFAALRQADLASLPSGKHVVDGNRLAIIVGRDDGRGRSGAVLEAHQKYIDIQYVLSGDEEMGWRSIADCQSTKEPYSDERDVIFYTDESTSWVSVPPGKFAIFYPEDAHAPLAGTGLLHKAVAKVAVDWD
jgi:YhcH/YjgK/YiaL family protein